MVLIGPDIHVSTLSDLRPSVISNPTLWHNEAANFVVWREPTCDEIRVRHIKAEQRVHNDMGR